MTVRHHVKARVVRKKRVTLHHKVKAAHAKKLYTSKPRKQRSLGSKHL